MSSNLAACGCTSYTDAPRILRQLSRGRMLRSRQWCCSLRLAQAPRSTAGSIHTQRQVLWTPTGRTQRLPRGAGHFESLGAGGARIGPPLRRYSCLWRKVHAPDAALRRQPLHRTELSPFPPYGGAGLKSVRKQKMHTPSVSVCVAQTLAYAMSARRKST